MIYIILNPFTTVYAWMISVSDINILRVTVTT